MLSLKKPCNTAVSSAHDWAQYLSGQWHLARQITDFITANNGTLTGTATFTNQFTDQGKETEWSEQGRLRLGDYEGDAWQRYRLTHRHDQPSQVQFPDGRLFFTLPMITPRAPASGMTRGDPGAPPTHLGPIPLHQDSPPDYNKGQLTVIKDHEWRLYRVVTGPRKHYEIKSVYTQPAVTPPPGA